MPWMPELVNDIGAVHTVRASNRFRVTFETNRYSVPAEYASQRLTLKSYPERLCIYHQDRLVARHLRSYERHRDFEHPDTPPAPCSNSAARPPPSACSTPPRAQRLYLRCVTNGNPGYLETAQHAVNRVSGLFRLSVNPLQMLAGKLTRI